VDRKNSPVSYSCHSEWKTNPLAAVKRCLSGWTISSPPGRENVAVVIHDDKTTVTVLVALAPGMAPLVTLMVSGK